MNMGGVNGFSLALRTGRLNNGKSKSVYFPLNCQNAPDPLLVC